MRITTKFIGSSTLLITLSAFLFGGSYAINQQTRKSLGETYTQSKETMATVTELDIALEDQVTALSRLAVLKHDTEEREDYIQSRLAFFNAINTLEANAPANDRLFLLQLEGIRRQRAYLDKIAPNLISTVSTEGTDRGQTELSEVQTREIIRSLKLFEQSIQGPIQSLRSRANGQMTAYQNRHDAFHDQLGWLQMLGFGLIILMLFVQFYGLLRPVIKALQSLQAGTERLGLDATAGARKIHIATGDELQALAESFNQMSDRLEAEASLKQALAKLKQTQLQLLQTEKMSSLGQLVAGVAHEINNPVSFIQGNLAPAQEYMTSLLSVIKSYQAECPEASDELQAVVEQADLAFIKSDFPKLLGSMETGAERIAQIVRSLQTFSHLDESETKLVDIHEGIDSAVFLITAQLSATEHRPAIQVIRHYADLPKVSGYPSQLNQVFMGLLTNSIDALSPPLNQALIASVASYRPAATPTITITTDRFCKGSTDFVRIRFTDNGVGISEATRSRIFDPFFTTKPVGSGMGLGLSMSYQIMVVNHKGKLTCESHLGMGSTFTLEIPLNLKFQLKLIEPLVTVTTMPGLLTS
jgi:signal transduction histidine kinase